MDEMVKTVLRYGHTLTDIDIVDCKGHFVRIRTIAYDGVVYYLEMDNGTEILFKEIGKTA